MHCSHKTDARVRSFSFLLQTHDIVTLPPLLLACLSILNFFFWLSISDFLYFASASFKQRQGCPWCDGFTLNFRAALSKRKAVMKRGSASRLIENAQQFRSVHLEKYETTGESYDQNAIRVWVLTRGAASSCIKGDGYHSARMHLLAAMDNVEHYKP